MTLRVTICIPTFRRPELLAECLESCLRQTRLPDEILVGDDSPGREAAAVVSAFQPRADFPVRVLHNDPPAGQAGNADRLFSEASGELVALMHDDDLFLPEALALLVPAFEEPAVYAAFGKQRVLSANEEFLAEETEWLNAKCRRTSAHAGLQGEPLISAITGQFPNNGYVIRAEAARAAGYRRAGAMFGNACDYGFGILAAQAMRGGKVAFVDAETACYRKSERSLSRANPAANSAYFGFRYAAGLPESLRARPEVREFLCAQAPAAVAQAALLGKSRAALRWYFSRWHWRRIFSLGGARRLLLILRSLTIRGKAGVP